MRPILFFSAILLMLGLMDLNANPLAEYKWKNRIIVASMPGGEGQREAAKELKGKKLGIADRDLLLIDVTSMRMLPSGMKRLPQAATNELRERLSIGDDEPLFILIGKDGGVKARQKGALDLKKFFALIDTMPMRKEEMRRKKG